MVWQEGEQVGQYEILSELGRGGMATVYKAYHEQLDRHVAIKVMHQTFADDNNFTERFKRESQIVASLQHPHIVPVFDYNEHKGMPYLVMKLIEGRSLKQQLFKNPPTLDEIIHIMTAIADATTYAHDHGVLHRDIKPSNIVVDVHNVPYLADFGLARIAAAGESTMSADVLLGTPNYMSPEQARGAKNIDHRSDLYSLGIVLYELVVGQVPFSAQTPLAVIQDHIHTPLPRPSEINPEIPLSLERVLRKALAKNPNDRYDTANDLMSAFTEAVEAENVTELADNRDDIADDSLARWREAYNGHEASKGHPQSEIVDSIPQSALPTNTNTTPQVKSATFYQQDLHGRYWMMAGVGLFILSLFLIIAVILNASNSILEITELSQRIDGISQNTPSTVFYNLPDWDIDTALTQIENQSENARDYLSLAQAYYQSEQIAEARTAIQEGKAYANDLIRYLATSVSITNNAQDRPASLVYGILLYEETKDNLSDNGSQTFNSVSQSLYNQSLEAQVIDISRDNNEQLIEQFGVADAQIVLQSQITRILLTNNRVAMGQQRPASLSLRLWTDETHALPFGQLVNARFEILSNRRENAINLLNPLVETSTTPAWIATIADDTLKSLKD